MKWPIVSLASIPPVEPYLSERRARPTDYASQLSFAAILFEREQYFTALYNPHSHYGEAPPPDHANAWQPFPITPAALRMLRELHHWTSGPPPAEQPHDLFGLKEEALTGLKAILRPVKTHRLGYCFASRFLSDLTRHEEARALERIIAQLEPRRRQAATQNDIFDAMRREAWRVRTRVEGKAFTRFIKSEGKFCEETRSLAMSEFHSERVPSTLAGLIPLARAFGVGDDPCRAYFVNKVSKKQRKRILQDVAPHRAAIAAWVKTFDINKLPPEAAAFFWLQEAIEEMQGVLKMDP